jgi:hypothetical protein
LATTISIEDYKIQLLAALGSSWFRTEGNPPVPVNTTSASLGVRALLQSFEIFPLLHQALHGGPNFVPKSFYENLIAEAPCEGPFNFGYPEHSSSEQWSSTHRWIHPERRGEKNDGIDKNEFRGEYNGLDYMLLHNLYYIIFPEDYNAVNFINRKIETNYPQKIGFIQLGSHATPLSIEAFNTIDADNVISQDGDVTYRAGVEITLKPGFEVKRGGDFHAFIEPLRCGGSGQYDKNGTVSSSPYKLSHKLPTSYSYYLPRQAVVNSKQQDNFHYNNSGFINLYPNPGSGQFNISLDKNSVSEIQIFNTLGQTIPFAIEINKNIFVIDISNNPTGIYFVKITSANGKVNIGKVIYQ